MTLYINNYEIKEKNRLFALSKSITPFIPYSKYTYWKENLACIWIMSKQAI
jgi:hypothetical protein